jgi:hypothetical protein
VGDIYGAEPHLISGNMIIQNLGENEGWLSTNISEGTIAGNSELIVPIEFNTIGLTDGNYLAEIIIDEQFQEEMIIPVVLTVDHSMSMEEHSSTENLLVYPNPFTSETNISWNNLFGLETQIRIYDLNGKAIRHFYSSSEGINNIIWDGCDQNGNPVNQGVYFIILENRDLIKQEKILLIR